MEKPEFISTRVHRKIAVGMVTFMMVMLLGGLPSGVGNQAIQANSDIELSLGAGDKCRFWCKVGRAFKKFLGFVAKTFLQLMNFITQYCGPVNEENCERGPNGECLDGASCDFTIGGGGSVGSGMPPGL